MTRLKKLLLTLLFLVLALFGTIGLYGLSPNPYSVNFDSATIKTLDNIVSVVKKKGESLSSESYYNLVLAIKNRLLYIDYELGSIINSLPVSSVNGAIDINKRPTDSGLDSNGWPKYLNVPSDCPPPKQGKKYYHYFGYTPSANVFSLMGITPAKFPLIDSTQKRAVSTSGSNSGDFSSIGNYFDQVNASMIIPLNQDDIVSVPFTTRNASYSASISPRVDTPPPDPRRGIETYWISHCPGDFTGVNPTGKKPLPPIEKKIWNEGHPTAELQSDVLTSNCMIPHHLQRFTIAVDGDTSFSDTHRCDLDANTTYFMNVSLTPREQYESIIDSSNPFSHLIYCENSIYSRDGKKVCANLMTTTQYGEVGSIGSIRRPYAGPCIYEPPYPENYDSRTCGKRVELFPGVTKGCSDGGYSFDEQSWYCTDTQGKLPSQTFTQKCINNRWEWTEGYGKPMYSTYLCENTRVGAQTDTRRVVCSEERNNQIRSLVCESTSSTNSQTRIQEKEQCTFINGKYEWINIEDNGKHGSYTRCKWSEPTL